MQLDDTAMLAALTLPMLLGIGAVLCALGAWNQWHVIRGKHHALPRMRVATGVVRTLESVLTDRRQPTVKSQTLVQVDFSVGGKTYCCRDLYLFRGNWHLGDVGNKYDFNPGQQVGVYYDPSDPRRSALKLDEPDYSSVTWILVIAAILAIVAIGTAIWPAK